MEFMFHTTNQVRSWSFLGWRWAAEIWMMSEKIDLGFTA
jgi:hypothetical protein